MGLTRSRHNDNGAQKPGRRPSTEFTMNQQKWASKRWNSLCENTSCHLPGSISSQLTVGIYCVVRSPPTPAGFMWHVRRDPLAAHHIRVVTTLDFLCGFQPSAACCLCWVGTRRTIEDAPPMAATGQCRNNGQAAPAKEP